MYESAKIFAKIGLKSIFKWIKVVFPITLLSILLFSFSIIYVLKHEFTADGLLYFLALLISPLAIIGAVVLANKVAIQNSIQMIWDYKLADFIIPYISKYTTQLFEKGKQKLETVDTTTLKKQLKKVSVSDDELSKVQKSVLKFGLSKVNIDDVDFTQDSQKIGLIVGSKLQEEISELASPSYEWIYGIIVIQLIFLVLILFI